MTVWLQKNLVLRFKLGKSRSTVGAKGHVMKRYSNRRWLERSNSLHMETRHPTSQIWLQRLHSVWHAITHLSMATSAPRTSPTGRFSSSTGQVSSPPTKKNICR
jgi:hypothetical protein